jgi:hypothetical protein
MNDTLQNTMDHIEIYYDFGDDTGIRGWVSEIQDANGDYISGTAEWSDTRKYAIFRSRFQFPDLPVHIYVKGKGDKTESYRVI